MLEIGYALSSEEHRPGDLVRYAAAAEASGFRFALISDHFHPWTDNQGGSIPPSSPMPPPRWPT
jgi:coenzyme F420-dependent glucose-6-phosphate dehydrogenase